MKLPGFTLIELLMVIALISILAVFIVPNFRNAQQKARDAERKSDLRQIQSALRLYYNDYGKYPVATSTLGIGGCGTNGNSPCIWGTAWTAGASSKSYIDPLPKDPSSIDYRYSRVNLDSFLLQACLENANDMDGKAVSPAWATCSSGKMYEVKQ